MALLGGATSVWGPMLGVIPLVLINDYLSIACPSYFSVVLGLVLLGIVFFIPERHHRPAADRAARAIRSAQLGRHPGGLAARRAAQAAAIGCQPPRPGEGHQAQQGRCAGRR